MKSRQTQFPPPSAAVSPAEIICGNGYPFPRGARGVALVLVLAFIALCTVLVVAFFASVSTEAVSERAASSENSAAQLATSAVQLVEGTISYATEPKGDTSYAWACQPGMIRTYGGAGGGPGATTQGTASSDPLAYFKLYSSDNMILSGKAACNAYTAAPLNDVPANWDKLPSLYADLNAPLIKQVPNGTPTPTNTVIFPIVDPRAQDLGVEGFSTSATASTLDGTVPVTGAATANNTAADPTKFPADSGARLPMPVRWMYVLRDGTTTVPPTGNATGASWVGATVTPTPGNPIVGRVAFWTDDEDAKINVNTASEGTYADMPVANAGDPTTSFVYPQTAPVGDVMLAVNQGAQHEYQRYPGHPATTCLSSVFGVPLLTLGTVGTAGLRANVVKAITDAIPRVSDYVATSTTSGRSSMGGTQDPAPSPYPAAPAPTPTPLTPDFDRLYASLDEFQFIAPAQNPAQPRAQQTLGATGNTEQNLVDTCRFFLTAHSKAPELNLFGLPRVTMWPTWDKNHLPSGKTNTSFDEEIVRCSTVANGNSKAHAMAFTRYDPTSASNDFTSARNQQVYGYLKTLTGRGVPGFGGNFSTKYGSADQSQILTEIFDYVRCTNLADQSDGTLNHTYTPSTLPGGTNVNVAVGQVVPTQNGGSRGFGRIATVAELALVLTKVDDRNDINQQEGLIYYTDPVTKKQITVNNVVKSLSYTGDTGSGSIDPTKKTLLEWALVPKCFSPMAGYAGLGNDFRFKFAVTNLKIGDAPVINKPLGTLADLFDIGRLPNGGRDAVLGGLMGFSFLVNSSGGGAQPTSLFPTGLCEVTGVDASATYALTNSTTGGTIPVSGTVQVTVYSPNASSSPIQTLNFEFPTVDQNGQTVQNVPIPEITYGNGFGQPTGTFRQATYSGNYAQSAYAPTKTATFTYSTINSQHGGGTNTRVWNSNMDHMLEDGIGTTAAPMPTKMTGSAMVRSLVPTGMVPSQSPGGTAQISIGGDLRYIAANPSVPKQAWQLAQKNVSSGTLSIAGGTPATPTDYTVSNLRLSNYYAVGGGKEGSLISLPKALSYGRPPEIPPGIPSAVMAASDGSVAGDWDNGPGNQVDGPYVNKPNEGESLNASGAGGIPYVGPGDITSTYTAAASIYFSPNLQISSPVMLGSLPVGLDHPWRTLLFRPATLPGYQSTTYAHPGGADATIRDHLLLDLFWMPIVDPYGISEPFATSGKINLNTQIAPFTYITRTTGLRAVLKSVMITALNPAQKPNSSGGSLISSYKNPYGTSTGSSQNPLATTRYPIDLDQTLSQITSTLFNPTPPADTTNPYPEFARIAHTGASPNFFVSASQICDLPLVPLTSPTTTPGNLSAFWTANTLTGDNSVERPYSLIYPRVTTKSNIFTVHVLAQSLKKITSDPNQNVWNEGRDQVLSEYRGAYTVEKYFDPNTDNLTDSSGNILDPNNDQSIDPTAGLRTTKWRLVGLKRFGQ